MYGKLIPSDSDRYFDGKFYIPGIMVHTIWSSSDPSVSIATKEKFYACVDCCHLWSSLEAHELKKVLEKAKWQGAEQFEQVPKTNILIYISSIIIAGFLLLLLFTYLDEKYFS